MAIPNHAGLLTNIAKGIRVPIMIPGATIVSAQPAWSMWLGSLPIAGAIPSTAAAPDYSTPGSIVSFQPANDFRVLISRLATSLPFTSIGLGTTLLLCDRLSHQGGLSGILASAQTTNLPTAALTRYTSAVGVMAALEVYVAMGASATTATISYTNSNGTAGQTSKERAFGGNNLGPIRGFVMMPPADGDLGFKSVESVTLIATTGSAGNFGVTLFKPLIALPIDAYSQEYDMATALGCMYPLISKSACLFGVVFNGSGTVPIMIGDLLISED